MRAELIWPQGRASVEEVGRRSHEEGFEKERKVQIARRQEENDIAPCHTEHHKHDHCRNVRSIRETTTERSRLSTIKEAH